MKIIVSDSRLKMDERKIEIVERKGIGHPDTLADGVAEAISTAYSRYCLDQFGAVLHHNVDKIAFVGGKANVDFGVGEMISPVRLILNGRMSVSFGKKSIDCLSLQKKAAKEYIQSVLPHFNTEKWLEFIPLTNSFSHFSTWFKPVSLNDLPDYRKPHANDTACCVGYWPLSKTEKLVIELEGSFRQKRFSFIGQDIKVMAVRNNYNVDVTMCIPFISLETPNLEFYKECLAEIKEILLNKSYEILGQKYKVSLHVNTADNLVKGDHYLLLSGTALEGGEEGVVGRGNRINGLIPCMRPYTMEAPFGKNPNYHVGKVYGYLANQTAKAIAEELDCECNVYITTVNGDSLVPPRHVFIETNQKRSFSLVKQIAKKTILDTNYLLDIVYKQKLSPKKRGL